MISNVFKRAQDANIGEVFVAAEDQEIIEDVKRNGGNAILTSKNHKTGTDRIYEAFVISLKISIYMMMFGACILFFAGETIALLFSRDKDVIMITGNYPNLRLRRNRKESWSRRLTQESTLSPNDFILPIFLIDGSNKKESISTMPGVYRYTINRISQVVDRAIKIGIPMVALFPKTKNSLKNEIGSESLNENNLVCKAIIEIKRRYKNKIGVMCDVALDPYTTHGHDGLVINGEIVNDESVEVLCRMAKAMLQ